MTVKSIETRRALAAEVEKQFRSASEVPLLLKAPMLPARVALGVSGVAHGSLVDRALTRASGAQKITPAEVTRIVNRSLRQADASNVDPRFAGQLIAGEYADARRKGLTTLATDNQYSKLRDEHISLALPPLSSLPMPPERR